jgi:hypothetical protein
LELFSLLAKHFHVQVTRILYPVFVDFDRQTSDKAQAALLIGKDSDDMGAAFELLINPFKPRQPFPIWKFLSAFANFQLTTGIPESPFLHGSLAGLAPENLFSLV